MSANDTSSDSQSDSAAQTGWMVLFDGASTSAWRGFQRPDLPSGWQAVDGALTRVSGGGDLVTRDQFGDFELELEWKVAPKGNSGIMFRVSEGDSNTYRTGPEMQVLDDAGHRDGQNRLTAAGSNYALHAVPAGVAKPAGEWNQVRLVVRGAHVEHWLNGQKVVEYELWSPQWEALVKASKFAAWPGYGRSKRGHIALQDHGDWVAFRNIRIRELK
ncbi:MAG: 3-keto-disaccharide hydrolase [Gemmatimonadaceae bacterium]